MATTDTTTILSIDPLQETLGCYEDHQSFLGKQHDSSSSELINTHSTRTHLATSPNSILSSSSSSSMGNSRLSLPSLWHSDGYSSATIDSSASFWSFPTNSNTYDSDQDKSGLDDLQQRRPSLDSLTPSGSSFHHSTAPGFSEQQWYEPANNAYGKNSTNSCMDWMAPSNYTTSCHPLRSIWSTSVTEQQQPSHQRRMSLSSDRFLGGPSDAHYRDLDQVYSYGRRHSLAGPLVNKSSTPSVNARQSYPGCYYPMNAIDEFDTSSRYGNAQYSRQRQLELNRKILDHIDEYFGGSNNTKGYEPSTCGTTSYAPSYYQQQNDLGSYGMNQTMTAGGDAANFGSSTVLMGKGIPLHHFLNSSTLLYSVEFKAGRTDICYIMQGDQVLPKVGDLVIVEADRGHDLGKVTAIMTANDILQHHHASTNSIHTEDDDPKLAMDELPPTPPLAVHGVDDDDSGNGAQKIYAKRLYRLADAEETMSLATKQLDEEKALMVCQAKIQQKELPMRVVNAEYQWDRRKLTFYFLAEQRIDFRELVRELFKNYKTRIWMCALKPDSTGRDSSVNE